MDWLDRSVHCVIQDLGGSELHELLSDRLVASAQSVIAVIQELRSQHLIQSAADQVRLLYAPLCILPES